eukprot:TRINITY_DN23137_c0_g1_i1.p1 TRINITY_DN23137_c0_g1~~TRINITY_DN23137_c0_g1_i1.p1  ORF type:complete len:559 (-),score=104.93 TRINITY_DN23137_c0_g1_i1:92-1768(-)
MASTASTAALIMGMNESEAATRIQAIYRGKQDRQRMREALQRELSDGTDDICPPTPTSPRTPTSPSQRSQRSSTGNIQRFTLTRSFSQLVVPASRNSLRRELERNPSCWPPTVQRWRIEAYILFEVPASSRQAQAVSLSVLFLTLISISAFILETMPELKSVPANVWFCLEVVCTVFFTTEYAGRLFVCTVGRDSVWRFLRSPMNVIDLMSILPFYLWLLLHSGGWGKALGILRTVRLIRFFRIVKLGKYSRGLQLMVVALKGSSQALWVLCFFLFIGIILFSSAIFYVERLGCPDYEMLVAEAVVTSDGSNRTLWDNYLAECRAHSVTRVSPTFGLCCDEYGAALDFPSIVHAFWWAVVTMTTVGFGDVYPRTGLGRLVGAITMLSGILLIALPIAIIGQKFQEAYDKHVKASSSDATGGVKPTRSFRRFETRASQSQKSQAPKVTLDDDGVSLSDMTRRLRLMQPPTLELGMIARDIADDLDLIGVMQKEIYSTQEAELRKQKRVLNHFDEVLKYLRNPPQFPLNSNANSGAGEQPERADDRADTADNGAGVQLSC